MILENIDELRQQYADKYVVVDPARPELARWADVPGQIKTINQNGYALVQFEGADRGWHDIDLAWLKIVEPPQPTE